MSIMQTVTIETRLDELTRLTEAVENLGEQENWSLALVGKVNLVLEELAMNTINHGHDEGLHEITVTFNSTDDALTIDVVDDGKPFDPLTRRAHTRRQRADSRAADRRAGGLPGTQVDGRADLPAGRGPQPPDARRLPS